MTTTRRHAFGLLAGLPAASGLLGGAARAGAAGPATPGAGKGLKLAARSKLLMIGDSITDAERARPVGEGLREAIGKGYVMTVDALLAAVYPQQAIRVVNQGISGNTVRDLDARWQADVMDLKPDWVSVMIGANDVWRQFDLPRQTERHVLIEEYESTLDALVRRTLPAVNGMLLVTPFYLEPNRSDAMRATMDRYGAAVRRLAERHRTLFVDSQAAFDEVLTSYYPATISWDRVHLNHIGAMVLARAIVNVLGFSWS